MQRKGDCDFFAWANNEMTTYKTKIMDCIKLGCIVLDCNAVTL
jgi:hypothetical protein